MDAGFTTIRSRRPLDGGASTTRTDSTYGSGTDRCKPATHDISRVSFHVKQLDDFVITLQESASRAFPNRGRLPSSSARYTNVQALLLHWQCDDLFVLPELEDLEKCLREVYNFQTDIFSVPSENAHLELMLKIGDMIKKHESEDTLFLVYYGGHARIDESRQSTWCATRHAASPWLQWSAIQTLLERSASDVLILLDCCAGAASATFPNGQSITETISASSWDAIAPDPGRYSFTNALIEVLQEWGMRIFSAAMLHAEILARLKHPRPILINGKHFEARSTPVHFMMTSNHKAPSIELTRVVPDRMRPPSPPREMLAYHQPHPPVPYGAPCGPGVGRRFDPYNQLPQSSGHHGAVGYLNPKKTLPPVNDPNEDEPHVMISLALEDDQRLDVHAWEQWLTSFPALAKHVKIQGLFKSHSNLLLLSLPVMVWDLLPDDPACSFVAFIRSNNLLARHDSGPGAASVALSTPNRSSYSEAYDYYQRPDDASFMSGTTFLPNDDASAVCPTRPGFTHQSMQVPMGDDRRLGSRSATNATVRPSAPTRISSSRPSGSSPSSSGPSLLRSVASAVSLSALSRPNSHGAPPPPAGFGREGEDGEPRPNPISRTMILSQARSAKRTVIAPGNDVPYGPTLAKHVRSRLEDYFLKEPEPTIAVSEFLASNLGVEVADVHIWFHHRREQERMKNNLQNLQIDDTLPEVRNGARMILPGDLVSLLDIFPSRNVLVIDLRSTTDFDKSHIHNAVNLRAPLSFVQNATLEMIQDTVVDDQSRRSFSKWFQSTCVVFYDRGIKFSWECPVADALHEKFRRMGWQGHTFILKGHYREFSASFDKYISGSKMTGEAKKHLDEMRQQVTPISDELDARQARYYDWLRTIDGQVSAPVSELHLGREEERMHAIEQRQRELEAEFEAHFPALHKKAQQLRPPPPPFSSTASSAARPFTSYQEKGGHDTSGASGMGWSESDRFNEKAHLVGPLASGLDKMREAAMASQPSTPRGSAGTLPVSAGYVDKLGETNRYSDEYDEIDPRGEGLKSDPGFRAAGPSVTDEVKSAVPALVKEDSAKKGGKKKAFGWGRLRTGSGK